VFGTTVAGTAGPTKGASERPGGGGNEALFQTGLPAYRPCHQGGTVCGTNCPGRTGRHGDGTVRRLSARYRHSRGGAQTRQHRSEVSGRGGTANRQGDSGKAVGG